MSSAPASPEIDRTLIPPDWQRIDGDDVAGVELYGLVGIETEPGKPRKDLRVKHLQLDPRQMRSQAAVHAGTESNVHFVLAIEFEALRRMESARIEIGPG